MLGKLVSACVLLAALFFGVQAGVAQASQSQCPAPVPGYANNEVCMWQGQEYGETFSSVSAPLPALENVWIPLSVLDNGPSLVDHLGSLTNNRYGWMLLSCSTPGTTNCGHVAIIGIQSFDALNEIANPYRPGQSWMFTATQIFMCAGTGAQDPACDGPNFIIAGVRAPVQLTH